MCETRIKRIPRGSTPVRWSEQGPIVFNEEISSIENKCYPQTSLAYCCWYWDVLEPEKGQYAWNLIDNSLLKAHRHGQTLQIRMMPQSHLGTQIPEWYMKTANGFIVEYRDGEVVWQPDYRDPKYVEYWGELVRAFGQRYDGHPWLESVDFVALGYWGEWHTWTRPGMMPPWEIQKQLIDIYLESFTKTPLLMFTDVEQAMEYALKRGVGWRMDSLGDSFYCEPWCEMYDRLPMRIAGTGATDTWKTSPVVFEVGRTFAAHKESGWDIDNTIAEALRWHVSSVNAKHSPIPAEWLPGDDIVIEDRVCVPMLEPGKYRVRIGLLDMYSGMPAIKLPIKGRTDDNWHDPGEIEIEEWTLQ